MSVGCFSLQDALVRHPQDASCVMSSACTQSGPGRWGGRWQRWAPIRDFRQNRPSSVGVGRSGRTSAPAPLQPPSRTHHAGAGQLQGGHGGRDAVDEAGREKNGGEVCFESIDVRNKPPLSSPTRSVASTWQVPHLKTADATIPPTSPEIQMAGLSMWWEADQALLYRTHSPADFLSRRAAEKCNRTARK